MRNLDAFLARLSSSLATADLPDLTHAADLAIDEFVLMKRTTPGFGIVDFGEILSSPGGPVVPDTKRMLNQALENNVVVADRLRDLIAPLLRLPGDESLARAFVVAVEAADAVLKLAFRACPDGDADLIAECKRLVRSYLSTYFN
jgi:hypothetical protein